MLKTLHRRYLKVSSQAGYVGFILLLSLGNVWGEGESPFGEIIPQQEGGADAAVAGIVKFLAILGGIGIIGAGIFYAGAHVLGKMREANTSKEGAGSVLGAVGLGLVVLVFTGVIGGALLFGADGAGELVAGAFGNGS